MHTLGQKSREIVARLAAAFDSPETLIDTITAATLIPNNSPCAQWGPYNRVLVALRGTSDARGFRQWEQVGRHVKKGARAFHIFVPKFKKVEIDEEEKTEGQVLIGFSAAPVFAIQDTEGEPLPELAPKTIPRLQTVAEALGVEVHYAPAVSERVHGVYQYAKAGEHKAITLYSHDLGVFYHELAHALHHRTGKLRGTKDAPARRSDEIVAEISAAVLVNIFEGETMGRQALQYIQSYGAKKKHLLDLLPEIMEVVDLALHTSQADAIAATNA